MFAGIGLVIASMPEQTGEECRPAKPLPVVILSGTADTVVPYAGGPLTLGPFRADVWSMDRLLAFFRRHNGCSGSVETSALPGAQRIELERSTNCTGGPVAAYKVVGGTHASTPNALNVGTMLLDFFGAPAAPRPAPAAAAVGTADDDKACHQGGVGEENIAACSRLIAANKSNADARARAYLRRGFLHGRRGERDDLDRTVADCGEVRRLQPANWHALYIRAAAYIRKGDLARALTDLNQAMRVAPNNTGVRNVFGAYYLAKGDDDRALAELNEALRIAPGNHYASRSRGLVYEKKGEFEKALADFRTALGADPGRTELLGREAAQGIDRIERSRAVARP
jgi:Flp pilus assembly protein TadD